MKALLEALMLICIGGYCFLMIFSIWFGYVPQASPFSYENIGGLDNEN